MLENLDTFVNLDSLYIGKNKITKIQNLDMLTNLTVLSMQVSFQPTLKQQTTFIGFNFNKYKS